MSERRKRGDDGAAPAGQATGSPAVQEATSAAGEFAVQPPDPRVHREGIIELIARSFESYWMMRQYCHDGYIDSSHYDWASSRIGLDGDEIIGHFGVFDFGMRVCADPPFDREKSAGRDVREKPVCATIKVAGIGAVTTHDDHRGHGLMARIASSCIDELEIAGYDLSLLYGIRNFYHRFGYVRAWPDTTWEIHWKELETGVRHLADVTIEPFHGHLATLSKLYNRFNDGVSGTAVRPTYRTNRYPPGWRISAVARAGRSSRQTGAYLVTATEEDSVVYIDGAGDPSVLLRGLARIAEQARAATVRFRALPYRSALAEELRKLTCTVREQYVSDGGAMVRTVNLAGALSRLSPVLSARMAASPLRDFHGHLLLRDEREEVLLSIEPGTVRVGQGGTEMPPPMTRHPRRKLSDSEPTHNSVHANDHLARLLIGAGDPREIARQAGFVCRGDGQALLSVLFPDQRPSLVRWDQF